MAAPGDAFSRKAVPHFLRKGDRLRPSRCTGAVPEAPRRTPRIARRARYTPPHAKNCHRAKRRPAASEAITASEAVRCTRSYAQHRKLSATQGPATARGAVLRAGLPPQQFDQVFGTIEQYAEVGEGSLDMPAIIQAGLESGSEYFLIEQDETYDRDVWESLRISRDNLIRMGYQSWL